MAAAGSAPVERAPHTEAYARYVLGALFVVYVFNFIDRQILSILMQPIKEELGVSDTLLGLLTGPAFALFYTFAGIPIARYADTGVRRSVIAAGLAVWSVMTAASGLAQMFWHLAVARLGVGIGEAACSPPAHALIADYFPPHQRARALAIYASGIHFGIMFGYLIGGWIGEFFGWRAAFLVVGIPGVLLAVVVRLTVREPARGASEGTTASADAPSVREVGGFLWKLRSFRHLALGSAMQSFAGYGIAIWTPIFLMRVHGMGLAELGTWLGLITGIFGALGAFLGGALCDRFGAGDPRWFLRVPAISTVAALPFSFALLFYPQPQLALLLSIPSTILGAMWLGPIFSTTQTLVGLRMRATASALLLFVINLIGLGLGPQVVGILNDLLADRYGDEAVRYTLAIVVTVMSLWAALHFTLGTRTLREDLLAKDA